MNMELVIDDQTPTTTTMMMMMSSNNNHMNDSDELQLPGFRFHPTEEELLSFYLRSMVLGKKFRCNIIGFLNIYNYDPRDLPRLAKIGEREWYFFVPRDRKHGSGGRPNRTTETGFWKATGSDRKIISTSEPKRVLGLKKTLVFYQGRAPHGSKTNWVMNEYRLPDKSSTNPKDTVLCKIYMKATSLKVLEQRAAMEEDNLNLSPSPPPLFCNHQTHHTNYSSSYNNNNNNAGLILKKEIMESCEQEEEEEEDEYNDDDDEYNDEMEAMMTRRNNSNNNYYYYEEKEKEKEKEKVKEKEKKEMDKEEVKRTSCLVGGGGGNGMQNLTELQLPNLNSLDWTQDSFWTQLSPWLIDHFTPYLLNY